MKMFLLLFLQSAVYALAREMGFKVLEVNASMGRSGRQVNYIYASRWFPVLTGILLGGFQYWNNA